MIVKIEKVENGYVVTYSDILFSIKKVFTTFDGLVYFLVGHFKEIKIGETVSLQRTKGDSDAN